MPTAPPRCGAHPARLAHDRCPDCGRPRCRPDALAGTAGCGICVRLAPAHPTREVEGLVRAGLATALTVPVCGAVGTQYVDAGASGVLLAALSAVVVAEAVLRSGAGAPLAGRALRAALRGLAVGGSVLAVAAALAFTPGRTSLVEPVAHVVPAYVTAALTAVVWTRPRRRSPPARGFRGV